MSTRFRKRIKLFPGININLSKSGVSTSVGVRGASVTVGRGKTRTNVGIPGTGLSHNTISTNQSSNPTAASKKGMSALRLFGYGIVALFIFILLRGLTQ